MKTSIERLVYMANQIAANLTHEPDPAGATTAHIVTFWDPRMKAMITAAGVTGLSPVAAVAIAQLHVRA
jgi:formate dehydrogenase subunit delta